ncbi:hypothetical protein CKO28_26420 [Rhodovibrio sodomensis]|uniref:ISAs1 family transposase n=1 Tax=Rhodovibrio sodomensis TaxID=1088 RepID=A0ABS1DPX2_9PROT|nr:hypothetical protein [Rhodovibrio sodomensis]
MSASVQDRRRGVPVVSSIRWYVCPSVCQLPCTRSLISPSCSRKSGEATHIPRRSATWGSRDAYIALDGKTLKRSFDQLNDQAAAATLSAFASDDALILAHTELDGSSDEVAAVQEMIADLNVSGVLFTVDALHCQKNL